MLTGLRHELGRLAKKRAHQKEHELLILNERMFREPEPEAPERLETISGPADTAAQAEELVFLSEAFSLLTPEQRKVIRATVLQAATEKEVARKMGLSQPAVHRIKKRGLNRLRQHLLRGDPAPGRGCR